MLSQKNILISLSLLFSVAVNAQTQKPVELPKAGEWQITRSGDKPPRDNGADTVKKCVTAEQLKANPLVLMQPDQSKGPKCTTHDIVMKDGKVSYSQKCKMMMMSMNGSQQGTYSSTQFQIAGEMNAGGRKIKTQLKGTYLGACPAK